MYRRNPKHTAHIPGLKIEEIQIGDTLVALGNIGAIRQDEKVRVVDKRSWKVRLDKRSPNTGVQIEISEMFIRYFRKEQA